MEHLIETWGYLAVLWAGLHESDTLLILAGFAARRGYLDLSLVILIAYAGTIVGAQLLFLLGRRRGDWLLARFPRIARRIERTRELLDLHHSSMVLFYRFSIGLRSVIPIAIGMSRIPPGKFLRLNLLGALVWVLLISMIGYLFGAASEHLIHHAWRYEGLLMATIVAAVGGKHRRQRERGPCQLSPDAAKIRRQEKKLEFEDFRDKEGFRESEFFF